MKLSMTLQTLLCALPALSYAFTTSNNNVHQRRTLAAPVGAGHPSRPFGRSTTAFLVQSIDSPSTVTSELRMTNDTNDDKDNEIERLKSMAAKLRAEAAALEAQQAQELAEAARKAFEKFDVNQDGQITVQELKTGLEKKLKIDNIPESRVTKLMKDFDKSGDGVLSADEFVTIEQFRNKLEALARDEKAAAIEKERIAKAEAEASKFVQAQMDLLNDKPPTNTDKLISLLPYLFPLLDGLQFARFLIMDNPENPVFIVLTLIFALYRSIPLSGFIAFLALSVLSGNPRINRLIRFNMQQAIFLDIALFFPGLLAGLIGVIGQGAGVQLPPSIVTIGSDLVFVTLLGTISYAAISSLLGKTPDQIPFISDAVNQRMPTIDMFDSEGRFVPRNRDEKDNKKDDDQKKD